jgi:ABC-type amino acid transport substrate-binding protein
MVRRFGLLLVAALATTGADAQEQSRLDAIQKSGVLRVCTPGDYRPFSLARSDGGYEGLDVVRSESRQAVAVRRNRVPAAAW